MRGSPSSSAGSSAADRLRAVPLFAQLEVAELERIAQASRERRYPRNSIIVFANDPGDALFVVLDGEVKVVLGAEDGREVILSILRAGSVFGEMALLDDRPRSATVIAATAATLLVLRREDFHRCLDESPRIALGLLRALSSRLRKADETIGGLVLLDVAGRVARLLLQLADEHGGPSIPRTVTQHTIAQMVGTSRETVSRTLRDLQDRAMVRITRDQIRILDRVSLQQLAALR